VTGVIGLVDGSALPVDAERMLGPLERALRALVWSVVLLAAALAITRLS
jgi:hypothetical protein